MSCVQRILVAVALNDIVPSSRHGELPWLLSHANIKSRGQMKCVRTPRKVSPENATAFTRPHWQNRIYSENNNNSKKSEYANKRNSFFCCPRRKTERRPKTTIVQGPWVFSFCRILMFDSRALFFVHNDLIIRRDCNWVLAFWYRYIYS